MTWVEISSDYIGMWINTETSEEIKIIDSYYTCKVYLNGKLLKEYTPTDWYKAVRFAKRFIATY